jgi:hypothetical protein
MLTAPLAANPVAGLLAMPHLAYTDSLKLVDRQRAVSLDKTNRDSLSESLWYPGSLQQHA